MKCQTKGPTSKPSALSGTLSRALNVTVTTVIAGQLMPMRTTVKQPNNRRTVTKKRAVYDVLLLALNV